jgi:glucan phosphoethanolaminetransferase (alkaline phosphatase superfamily)
MKSISEYRRLRKSITHHFLLRSLHLLEAATVFFLSSSLMGFSVYILGNFQSFLESTQLRILSLVQITGIIGLVVSLYYLVFLISWIIRRRRIPVARLIYALFALTLHLALAIGSLLIQDLSRGIG